MFTGTLDARLLALDADTGRPCEDFGDGRPGGPHAGMRIRDVGAYLVTSPPAIYGNVVIVGSAIGDNRAVTSNAASSAPTMRAAARCCGRSIRCPTRHHPAAAEWNPAQAQARAPAMPGA